MTNKSESQRKRTRHVTTAPPFHQRFNIKVQDQQAKERFLSRVWNQIVLGFLVGIEVYKYHILMQVANALGKEYHLIFDFNDYVGGDFYACLQALEAAYQALPANAQKEELDTLVQHVISQSEVDLGIRWRDGVFWPSGAKVLDEALVNDPLQWLSDPVYKNILAPFKKGLSDYLQANRYPERLSDTITDMYEAVEAMAKVATGNDRDLSANRELFVRKLRLSGYYKKMLQDYISYANQFRHAVEEGKQRVPPLAQEVEAFIYTTGLFIRLAIERLTAE